MSADGPRNDQAMGQVSFDEHEGSMLATVPSLGLVKEKCKAAGYFVVGEQVHWRWNGDLMEMCKAFVIMLEQTPGMSSIVEGIMEARAAERARGGR